MFVLIFWKYMFLWIQKEGASQLALELACQFRSYKHMQARSPDRIRKIFWRIARNPLQNPCLGNPMDRGAWRAALQWVAKSQTPLKCLSMQVGTHSKGNCEDAICTAGGLGCLVLLMPRQYCHTCQTSPQPLSSHQTRLHTGAVYRPCN